MDVAVQIVWWMGLVVALILTLAILKAVALVLRALSDILRLAKLTNRAAEGVADNVAVGSPLAALGGPAAALVRSADRLAGAVRGVERELDGLTSSRGRGAR